MKVIDTDSLYDVRDLYLKFIEVSDGPRFGFDFKEFKHMCQLMVAG